MKWKGTGKILQNYTSPHVHGRGISPRSWQQLALDHNETRPWSSAPKDPIEIMIAWPCVRVWYLHGLMADRQLSHVDKRSARGNLSTSVAVFSHSSGWPLLTLVQLWFYWTFATVVPLSLKRRTPFLCPACRLIHTMQSEQTIPNQSPQGWVTRWTFLLNWNRANKAAVRLLATAFVSTRPVRI